MTDRFNPETHKFGMAYALEGGFIFYPFPLQYDNYDNSDMIDGLVIHLETSCRHPSDEMVDTLTRAPEHDLVPRQAVTGDAWQMLRLIAQGYTVKVYEDRYVVVENPEYEPDNGKDPNICFDIESISAHPRPAVSDSDISKCPKCGGCADNGFDRCLPPSPYFCTKCEAAEKEQG